MNSTGVLHGQMQYLLRPQTALPSRISRRRGMPAYLPSPIFNPCLSLVTTGQLLACPIIAVIPTKNVNLPPLACLHRTLAYVQLRSP
jgi:hypothetical protein